jgi:dihydrofolate reductase
MELEFHRTPGRPWKAIAAMAKNRVIGAGNSIPWHIPEDFRWVKECTQGQTIAMGRKTFESLGKPLPRRENVVISRSATSIEGCTVLPSLEVLLDHPAPGDVWIFGGADIYRQALARVSDLFLTVVSLYASGDTLFPPFEDEFQLHQVVRRTEKFEIRHYVANQ